MDKPSVLKTAQDLIHGSRNKDYGHPLDDFSRGAKIWSAILGVEVTPLKYALCMIAVKISRLCNTPKHMDSMVDIAGYIGTYEMVLDEQERRGK